jgi:hypothetical protein
MTFPRLPVLLALASLAAWPGAPRAEAPPKPLRLELNRLEARDGGACRVWIVLGNEGAAVEQLRLDLVLFGRDGVVARRVAVDVGPLPEGRTQARIFDLAGQSCDTLGSVLLNDVLACDGTEREARDHCTERTSLASRVDGVAFRK